MNCDHTTGKHRCGKAPIMAVIGVPVPRRGVQAVNLCPDHQSTPDSSLVLIAGVMRSTGPADRTITREDITKDLVVWSHPHRGLARVRMIFEGSVQIAFPDGSTGGMPTEFFIEHYRIPGQPLTITV